ncbi:MAG: hypothetical protein V4714_19695 [Bacteroidota bacterium]
MNTTLTPNPELVLSKIERCLQSATNALHVETTQAFLSLYYQRYGHPLPEREQYIHEQLAASSVRLDVTLLIGNLRQSQ